MFFFLLFKVWLIGKDIASWTLFDMMNGQFPISEIETKLVLHEIYVKFIELIHFYNVISVTVYFNVIYDYSMI